MMRFPTLVFKAKQHPSHQDPVGIYLALVLNLFADLAAELIDRLVQQRM